MQLPSSTYGESDRAAATPVNRPDLDPFNLWLALGRGTSLHRSAVLSERHTYGVQDYWADTSNQERQKQSPGIYTLATSAFREPLALKTFDAELSPSPPSTSGPIKLVKSILATWRLQPMDVLPLLGYESTQWFYVEGLLNGRGILSGRDVKDRIACLFEIRRTLSGLFKDQDVENAWLRETHSMLNEQSPLDLLLQGSIENLLLVRDYVELAAGR